MQAIRSVVPSALALAAIAALSVADAHAVSRTRFVSANAASFCQTALPVFDGDVRKRPLAVQNEGASNAFLTCSFRGQGEDLDYVAVFAVNNTDAAVSLTCTAVTGAVTTPNQYKPKTITIPASGIQDVNWQGSDFGAPRSTIPGLGLFNVSCNLPPGVGIARAIIKFTEDVGA